MTTHTNYDSFKPIASINTNLPQNYQNQQGCLINSNVNSDIYISSVVTPISYINFINQPLNCIPPFISTAQNIMNTVQTLGANKKYHPPLRLPNLINSNSSAVSPINNSANLNVNAFLNGKVEKNYSLEFDPVIEEAIKLRPKAPRIREDQTSLVGGKDIQACYDAGYDLGLNNIYWNPSLISSITIKCKREFCKGYIDGHKKRVNPDITLPSIVKKLDSNGTEGDAIKQRHLSESSKNLLKDCQYTKKDETGLICKVKHIADGHQNTEKTLPIASTVPFVQKAEMTTNQKIENISKDKLQFSVSNEMMKVNAFKKAEMRGYEHGKVNGKLENSKYIIYPDLWPSYQKGYEKAKKKYSEDERGVFELNYKLSKNEFIEKRRERNKLQNLNLSTSVPCLPLQNVQTSLTMNERPKEIDSKKRSREFKTEEDLNKKKIKVNGNAPNINVSSMNEIIEPDNKILNLFPNDSFVAPMMTEEKKPISSSLEFSSNDLVLTRFSQSKQKMVSDCLIPILGSENSDPSRAIRFMSAYFSGNVEAIQLIQKLKQAIISKEDKKLNELMLKFKDIKGSISNKEIDMNIIYFEIKTGNDKKLIPLPLLMDNPKALIHFSLVKMNNMWHYLSTINPKSIESSK